MSNEQGYEGVEFVIEKGIPIPKKTRGGRSGLTATLLAMEIGDSVYSSKKQSTYGSLLSRLWPLKFTTRIEGEGTRIWRVE